MAVNVNLMSEAEIDSLLISKFEDIGLVAMTKAEYEKLTSSSVAKKDWL